MKNFKKHLPNLLIGLPILLLTIVSTSCRKDLDNLANPHWRPAFLTPLLNTELTLNHLVKDDSNFVAGPDGMVHIIYREDSIFTLQVDDVLEVPAQETANNTFKMGALSLGDLSANTQVTLNDILPLLHPTAQEQLQQNNGQEAPFPPMQLEQPHLVDLTPFEEFQHVSFSSGYLVMEIENELPVSMESLIIHMRQTTNQTLLGSLTFQNIAPGTTAIDSIPLAGKTIQNDLRLEVEQLSSPGSNGMPVLIDLNEGVNFLLQLHNSKVISGEVSFPNQVILEETVHTQLFTSQGVKLSSLELESATLNYTISTNTEHHLGITFVLPNTEIDGEPITKTIVLNDGGTQHSSGTINLANSLFDLRGDGTQYNQVPIEYELFTLPTNVIHTFDSAHQVDVDIQLENLKFRLARGDFGKQEFEIEDGVLDLDIDLLENFTSGLHMEDPQMRLTYATSVGVPVAIKPQITGFSYQGEQIQLESDTLYFLAPEFPFDTVLSSAVLDKNNSNLTDLLAMPPKGFSYSGKALANTTGTRENFATMNSGFAMGFEADLPLSLKTANLVLEQIVELDLGDDELEMIDSGELSINAENGFPLQALITIYFQDQSTGIVTDSIVVDPLLAAAVDASGRVNQPALSKISVQMDPTKLENFKTCDELLIKAALSTTNHQTQFVSLYTNYGLGVQLALKAKLDL